MRVSTAKKFNHIPLIFMFTIVTLLAIVFLVLSIFVLNEKVPENYVEVQASIVEINETEIRDEFTNEISYEYQVYIDYTYENETYKHKEYNKYDSSMKEGNSVTIYVNPDASEEYMSDTSDNFIFLVLSGVFFIVGIAGIVINTKNLVELKRRKD